MEAAATPLVGAATSLLPFQIDLLYTLGNPLLILLYQKRAQGYQQRKQGANSKNQGVSVAFQKVSAIIGADDAPEGGAGPA